MQIAWFSIPTSWKIMAVITNHQRSPTTLYSLTILANHLGVPPHAPHIVSQHPHKTAPPLLPCGKCAKLLSNCAIFLSHLKTLHHIIQMPTTHGHPKFFSPVPLLE